MCFPSTGAQALSRDHIGARSLEQSSGFGRVLVVQTAWRLKYVQPFDLSVILIMQFHSCFCSSVIRMDRIAKRNAKAILSIRYMSDTRNQGVEMEFTLASNIRGEWD